MRRRAAAARSRRRRLQAAGLLASALAMTFACDAADDGYRESWADAGVVHHALAEASVDGIKCPTGVDAASEARCPAAPPEPGSCCPSPGLGCQYPSYADWGAAATCSDIAFGSDPGPTWSVQTVRDHDDCVSPSDTRHEAVDRTVTCQSQRKG
jgi:hypothetical protein